MTLEFDHALIEDAVLVRIHGSPAERSYHQSRDPLYQLPQGDEKEAKFRRFHAEWFTRLELDRPFRDAVDEQPLIGASAGRCCVFAARSTEDEGADLHRLRDEAGGGNVLIRVRLTRLTDRYGLQCWLRHELMHVSDMLDPAFAYSPEWPADLPDPAAKNILRENYRLLWGVYIDGRMARRGWRPLDPLTAERFRAVYEAFSLTHSDLIELALNVPGDSPAPQGPSPCPLCRFPTFDLHPEGIDTGEFSSWIQEDFPSWRHEHGLCRQCADLYQASKISRTAAAMLPGI